MASVNQIIEHWEWLTAESTRNKIVCPNAVRVIAAFKKMREILRYVADQEMGVHGQVIDKLIDDSATLLAKLDAEE